MFYVVDEIHCEYSGGFETFELAREEILRRVSFPWDEKPNRAPCRNWLTCGRKYQVVESGKKDSKGQSIVVRICDLNAEGIVWHDAADQVDL